MIVKISLHFLQPIITKLLSALHGTTIRFTCQFLVSPYDGQFLRESHSNFDIFYEIKTFYRIIEWVTDKL